MPHAQAADLTGALAVVTSVLAALLERQTTGKGRRIEDPLYFTSIAPSVNEGSFGCGV